jgi:hypothetical protein
MLPQIIADTTDPLRATERHLAGQMLEALNRSYPALSRHWCVQINPGGVCTITNSLLSGRWGFVLHAAKIDPEMRAVVRAGGELLERYRVSRARPTMDQLRSLPRDRRGELIPDM